MMNKSRDNLAQTDPRRRGSVLLFCLGVLAVLSLLGTALVYMTSGGLRESQAYLDATRAEFVAESGIETGIAKLMAYRGSLPALNAALRSNPSSERASLRYLRVSSFGEYDLNGDGEKETAGVVSQSYVKDGDSFRLRISTPQHKLNINDTNSPINEDSDPYADQISPDWDYAKHPAHLKDPSGQDPDWDYPAGEKPKPKARGRLFLILRELLHILYGDDGMEQVWSGDYAWADLVADTLLTRRGQKITGSFETLEELQTVLTAPGLMSQDQFSLFKDYITLKSWRDDNVLKPGFQWCVSKPETNQTYYVSEYPMFAFIAFLLPFNNNPSPRPAFNTVYHGNNNAEDIYQFSDTQSKCFELDPRSPVDVNNASKPLLKALIRPLRGWRVQEEPAPGEVSTAEDFTQPTLHPTLPVNSFHPWFYHTFAISILRMNNGLMSVRSTSSQPDKSRYYYYDEFKHSYYIAGMNPLVPAQPICSYRLAEKNFRYGRLVQSSLTAVPGDTSLADAVADAIHFRVHPDVNGDGVEDGYKPFVTWQEFEDFLHTLCQANHVNEIPGLDQWQVSALIANFNPNARINDYNSDKTRHLPIDKAHLIANTTEFCFHSMGDFEIAARGEVLDADRVIVSAKEVRASVRVFEPFRVSTQAQFLKGWDPNQTNKQAKEFLGTASTETSGLDFSGAGGALPFPGCALQSYPEPLLGPADDNLATQSRFDGYLALSTLKPATVDLFAGNAVGFIAHMDASLSADLVGNSASALPKTDNVSTQWMQDPYPMTSRVQPVNGGAWIMDPDANAKILANVPSGDRLCRGTKEYLNLLDGVSAGNIPFHKTLPGNLYPDGAFSDAGRSLAYDARSFGLSSQQGRAGSISFWIKPAFDVAWGNRIRQFFTFDPKDYESTWSAGDNGYLWLGGPVANPEQWREFSLYYFPHGGDKLVWPHGIQDNCPPIYSAELGAEWLSTRALFLGAANAVQYQDTLMTSIGTTTVNQSWRQPYAENPNLTNQYHFETHQWNTLAFAWDFVTPAGNPSNIYMRLAVNGVAVEDLRHYLGQNNPAFNLHQLAGGQTNYVRFGESASAPFRNNVADSTYDMIVSSPLYLAGNALKDEFYYGRYYSENDAVYTSPDFDLFNETGTTATGLSLFSVSWTLYWPVEANASFAPNHPRFNANRDPVTKEYCPLTGIPKALNSGGSYADAYPEDPMFTNGCWSQSWAPISMDFYDNVYGVWYYEDNGVTKDMMPNFAGGSQDPDWQTKPISIRKGQSFRFRAHFNIADNQAVYATPILDEILFLFKMQQPRVLVWENSDEF